jgi:hypothetical protein
MPVRKVDESRSSILRREHSSLDMQIAGKIQMPLHCLPFPRRQIGKVGSVGHIYCKTLGAEVIGHTFAAANEHGRGGIVRDVDQNTIRWTLILLANFHFVRRLA